MPGRHSCLWVKLELHHIWAGICRTARQATNLLPPLDWIHPLIKDPACLIRMWRPCSHLNVKEHPHGGRCDQRDVTGQSLYYRIIKYIQAHMLCSDSFCRHRMMIGQSHQILNAAAFCSAFKYLQAVNIYQCGVKRPSTSRQGHTGEPHISPWWMWTVFSLSWKHNNETCFDVGTLLGCLEMLHKTGAPFKHLPYLSRKCTHKAPPVMNYLCISRCHPTSEAQT